MPKGERPAEVEAWIKTGRGKKTAKPTLITIHLNDLESWEHRWLTWWRSRQPEERFDEDGDLSQADDVEDWSKLDYHGTNGIMSFMIAAYCWGLVVTESGSESSKFTWIDSILDLSWCLHRLVVDSRLKDPAPPKKVIGKRSVFTYSVILKFAYPL